RRLLRACKRRCIAVGYPEDMPTPEPSTPMRGDGQSWSGGTSTEPATLGRVAAPRALTPIRKGGGGGARCCASSSSTRVPWPCDRRRRPTEKPGTGTLTWKTDATPAMSNEAASSGSCPQAMRPRRHRRGRLRSIVGGKDDRPPPSRGDGRMLPRRVRSEERRVGKERRG